MFHRLLYDPISSSIIRTFTQRIKRGSCRENPGYCHDHLAHARKMVIKKAPGCFPDAISFLLSTPGQNPLNGHDIQRMQPPDFMHHVAVLKAQPFFNAHS